MLKFYFFKRLRSYFFIMIIPTLFVFVVIGYFFFSSQVNSIKKQGHAALSSLEESMEASIYNIGYQLDAMTSNYSFSLSLKNVLNRTSMEQKERYFYDIVKNIFITYELAYPYIHSVYVHLDGVDRFMTSTSGQIENVNTFYDMEWLEIYESFDTQNKINTCKRLIQRNSYDEPVEVISVFYRNTYLKGLIVINIDKSKYGRLLRNLVVSERQKVFLVNFKGDIICSTEQDAQEIDIFTSIAEKVNLYGTADGVEYINNTWVKAGNDLYFVYIQHSKHLDIFQVSAISRNYLLLDMRYYIILLIFVLLLDIAIIFALAYFSTKRSFYYIKECVSVFSAAERGEKIVQKESDSKDEYGMILNNIIFMYLKSSQMQIELLEKQYQYEITEMTALQLQINPHFIFNTLQIMDFDIVRNTGIKSTSHKMIKELSKVVKYALTNPMEEITLKEELDYLKSYLEIQKVRFPNRVITYFEIDDEALNNAVFRLLLQPILENSFLHGMKGDNARLMIKVKVCNHKDAMRFTIIDNGAGICKDKLKEIMCRIGDFKSKNIGLTNANRRLILHYGAESRLKIQSKVNMGTVVRFTIPKLEKAAVADSETQKRE